MSSQSLITDRKDRSHVGEPGNQQVSIVVCTKNRPVQLDKAIASIRRSGPLGRQVEIIVVEESVSPRTLPDVRYVHLPEAGRGFGYARNRGVKEAQSEIVVFVDDDCEAESGWLEALIDPFFTRPEVMGVAGAVSVRRCGLIGHAENILGVPGGGLRYHHQAGGSLMTTRFLSTCNCAYRRSAILRAGGFCEEARFGGEDFLLAERVSDSGVCVFAPLAVVYHQTRDRWSSVFRWFVRRGRSEVTLLTTTHKGTQYLTYLVRSSWTVRALGVGLLVFHWPSLLPALPIILLMYVGVMLWRFRFALAYPRFRKAWWLVPAVKMTMDLGTEVGRLQGLMNQGRR